jgi:hypothetical protein
LPKTKLVERKEEGKVVHGIKYESHSDLQCTFFCHCLLLEDGGEFQAYIKVSDLLVI